MPKILERLVSQLKDKGMSEPSGRVYIEPVCSDEEDPVLGAFLDFVEADIKAHPDRIRAFDGALHDRLAALVGDVDVDLDAKDRAAKASGGKSKDYKYNTKNNKAVKGKINKSVKRIK